MKEILIEKMNLLKKDFHFVYAYLTGSYNLIDNPHDLDIVLLYDNINSLNEDQEYLLNNFNELDKIFKFTYKSKDYHITLLLNEIKHVKDIMKSFAYISGPYCGDILCGENDITDYSKYNLVTNIGFKLAVLKRLEYQINRDKDKYWMCSYTKKLYRLLATCYIIYNNSYELTDEQKQVLNQVHDTNEMSDELFDWCKNLIETKISETMNNFVGELEL